MFELSKLQEIYTGALISGKGKALNAINSITAKTRHKYEEWVRVRFGAGTPWRKCWAVVSQPDEKIIKKARAAQKKANNTAYQVHTVFKGDIKFFESKKGKKQRPIATMTDAYAAYALYPQSKQLIEQSTLVKIEGRVTIHADPPSESEGYVFVMPEVHPAVSGFETMLRFLFPTFDTFALYGRPGMLIPNRNDTRSLMFGMPREGSSECGYLDVVDVVNVIVGEGKDMKLENDWRIKLKEVTATKLQKLQDRRARPKSTFASTGQRLPLLNFEDGSAAAAASQMDLPPQHVPMKTPPLSTSFHQRSVSEGASSYLDFRRPPPTQLATTPESSQQLGYPPTPGKSETSSDDGLFQSQMDRRHQAQPSPEPVPVTPSTAHAPNARPQHPPAMPAAAGVLAASAAAAAFRDDPERRRASYYSNNSNRTDDEENLFEGVVPPRSGRQSVPPMINPMRNSFAERQTPPDPVRSMYPTQPLPEPHPSEYYEQQTQITQQSAMGYDRQIEPPPGFALQNSQVLLRGPPPTNDSKQYRDSYASPPPDARQNYRDSYASHPPPSDPRQSYRDSYASPPPDARQNYRDSYASHPPPQPQPQDYYIPQQDYHDDEPPPRFSWQPPPSNGYGYLDPYAEPLPSPPIPAKTPLRLDTNGRPTSPPVARKPVPNQGPQQPPQQPAQPAQQPPPAPSSEDDYDPRSNSLDSLARHMINDDALNRIGMEGDRPPEDEDTLDRRAKERLLGGGDSDSDYDSEPDYASIDSAPRPVKRDVDVPRAGRMKVVGQDHPPTDVIVGDVHYRPGTAEKTKAFPKDPVVVIPKVDFGMTMSHGRNLSGDAKEVKGGAVNQGNATTVERDNYPVSQYGTVVNGNDARRHSMRGLGVDTMLNQKHGSSRSSSAGREELNRRSSWNRPSPPDGEPSSDSDNSKRRSMVWSPGMATPGSGPERNQSGSAEQYVSDKLANAREHQSSRSRYLQQRRSSGQILRSGTPSPGGQQRNTSNEHLPPQASSRGVVPQGMASTPDLRAHLSATEQEYIARQTGSSLIQNAAKSSQPSTSGGLIGLVDKREREKKRMKEAFLGGQATKTATVKQEIEKRERERQSMMPGATPSGQRAYGRMTPSPRPNSGMWNEQQGYFPQQGATPGQQYYTPQQQMQGQQQGYFDPRLQQQQQQQQQQQGYGQQQQGYYGQHGSAYQGSSYYSSGH